MADGNPPTASVSPLLKAYSINLPPLRLLTRSKSGWKLSQLHTRDRRLHRLQRIEVSVVWSASLKLLSKEEFEEVFADDHPTALPKIAFQSGDEL
jgi:hypothetical protein